MKITYLHEFFVEFDALDKKAKRQLLGKLKEMSRQDLDAFAHQALHGEQFKGLFKLRAGDWRMIYQIQDDEVILVTLGHRSEIYR